MSEAGSLNIPPIGGKVRQKPWEAIGMSRASWYRHGKPSSNPRLSRLTHEFLAKANGIPLRTFQRCVRVMTQGPEIWERAVKGEISVAAAERQLAADQLARLIEAVEMVTERGVEPPESGE
jgi:hypothetical protein